MLTQVQLLHLFWHVKEGMRGKGILEGTNRDFKGTDNSLVLKLADGFLKLNYIYVLCTLLCV
jgi:hypothetical protein